MSYLLVLNYLLKNRLKNKNGFKSIAVFNSNDVFSTGADSTLPFEQHRNIFYLSGVDQEESILLVFFLMQKMSYIEKFFCKRN